MPAGKKPKSGVEQLRLDVTGKDWLRRIENASRVIE